MTNSQDALERLIVECVRAWDPEAKVRARMRPDEKMDVTVVSARFKGLDSREREALFWPALDPVPINEMVRLTYFLLLTPDEAARSFGPGHGERTASPEDWDE